MAALVALVLILAIFGGLGFAAGFFVGGMPDSGGRRWYGR